MDANAIFTLSYGLYLLSVNDGARDNACIINTAMQITDQPLRLTLGEQNTEEDVDYIIETVAQVISLLRSMSPVWENGKPNLTAASELHEHH